MPVSVVTIAPAPDMTPSYIEGRILESLSDKFGIYKGMSEFMG